ANSRIVAHHFYDRFQAMVRFLESPAQPLGGPLVDYFFRIEFQERGSPHVHGLVWIGGAPVLAPGALLAPEERIEAEARYLAFVDTVISARQPTPAEA